ALPGSGCGCGCGLRPNIQSRSFWNISPSERLSVKPSRNWLAVKVDPIAASACFIIAAALVPVRGAFCTRLSTAAPFVATFWLVGLSYRLFIEFELPTRIALLLYFFLGYFSLE